MTEEPFQIKVVKESVVERATRRQRPEFPRWILIALVGVLFAGGAFFLWSRSKSEKLGEPAQQNTLRDKEKISTDEETTEEVTPRELVVADDGQSLWVSPTAGAPLPQNYLPAGTQLILHLRPRELLAHTEGEKVLAALGPWGETAMTQLRQFTGVKLSEIRTLIVAVYWADDGSLQSSLRLQLVESWDEVKLTERLPEASKKSQGGQTIFEASGRACYLPNTADGKLLVSCPLAILEEMRSQGEGDTLFPREMQRLLDRTDADRLATLVFPNKFLQISGKKLFSGVAESLLTIAADLLRDDAAAVALSAHWDENFFLEMQSTVNLNQRPHAFAAAVVQRVEQFPDTMEDAVLAEPLHPFGRKVVGRFPNMLRKLSNYTRGGEVDGITVLRTYLPLPAGHNLLMAAELALQNFSAAEQTAVSTPAAQPATIAERLQQTTSLVFTKETLQKALEILSEDIGLPIRIAGGDLQLEGITKNQSLGLELRDRPAAEILLEILLKANPDRTATGPDDPKQKLVYLVKEDAGQSGEIIVTTRSAAQKRGDRLPPVFAAGEE